MQYVFFLVHFDTHNMYFKSHCIIDISIKNDSFDTHDMKPIHSMLFCLIHLDTHECFIFSVLQRSLVIQTGKHMDHLFISGPRGMGL